MLHSFFVNQTQKSEKEFSPEIKKMLKKQLIEFLILNPSPEDEEIHAIADENKVDKHEFEEIVYSILGNLLGGGKSKGMLPKDLDEKELKMGIEVEYEHTSDKDIATKIAIDHLTEIPDYYTRLGKMEEEAKKEKK